MTGISGIHLSLEGYGLRQQSAVSDLKTHMEAGWINCGERQFAQAPKPLLKYYATQGENVPKTFQA